MIADIRRIADVAAHFRRLDTFANCVGLIQEAKAEEFVEERWDHAVDTNLKSAKFQARAAARHMMAHAGGTQLGLRGRGYAAYCAAKGGLAVLCKQLAAEWTPHKIDVNVVAPTFVRTLYSDGGITATQ
jgi:NAD(P)-dependent dehydrogenase (short-subunit alcohol dehydrogenase family)